MLFVCVCGCDWDTDSCSLPLQPHKEIAIDFVCGGYGDDQSTAYCRFKAGGGYE